MKEPSEQAMNAAFRAMSSEIWTAPPEELVSDLALRAIGLALKAAYAIDFPEPKKKAVDESDHVVDWFWVPSTNEVVFSCSCGAGWNMFTKGPVTVIVPKIQEGIKSHLISVGLKPTEVL